MKTVIYIFLLLFGLTNCTENVTIENKRSRNPLMEGQKEQPSNDLIGAITLDELTIYTTGSSKDFQVSSVEKSDIITIRKVLYRDLLNSVITRRDGIELEQIEEQVVFDFKQYTIDDNPATPLNLRITKTFHSQNVNKYNLTNIQSNISWIEQNYFDEIKTKSVQFQRNFYTKLLADKKKYLDCCPEYIQKAEDFIKSDEMTFGDFNDLNVFPYVKERYIKISYKKDNKTIVKHIKYIGLPE